MTLLMANVGATPPNLQARVTPDDLLAMESDGHLYELVRGELVEKSMTYASNQVVAKISFHLVNYCERMGAGGVLQEQSFQCFPDDADLVRRPDLAFIAAARVPAELPCGHVRFSPDLAVEVLSPTNTAFDVDEKPADYWSAGVRMVWIVNAEARIARVHQPRQPIIEYAGDDVLLGDPVLPGFEMRVSALWPVTARR